MRTGLTLTDAEVRILTTALAGAYPHEVTMEAALDAFWHEDRRVLDGLTMMGALLYLGTHDPHPNAPLRGTKVVARWCLTQFGRAVLEDHLAQASAEA